VTKGAATWRLQRDRGDDGVEFACQGAVLEGTDYGDLRGTVSVNDESWHHVVGTYDGGKIYLYIGGGLDASQDAYGLMFTNNAPLLIGENAQQSRRTWDSLIDDVRIYNCALDANEVKTLYEDELLQ